MRFKEIKLYEKGKDGKLLKEVKTYEDHFLDENLLKDIIRRSLNIPNVKFEYNREWGTAVDYTIVDTNMYVIIFFN